MAEQQLRVAENRGQQVVEIVRDAAGEPSDAFDFLGLHQPFFEQPAVGDVARDAEMAVAVHARPIAAFDQARRVGACAATRCSRLASPSASSSRHAVASCSAASTSRPSSDRQTMLSAADAEQRARRGIRLDDGALSRRGSASRRRRRRRPRGTGASRSTSAASASTLAVTSIRNPRELDQRLRSRRIRRRRFR